jgi:hypothetical protein
MLRAHGQRILPHTIFSALTWTVDDARLQFVVVVTNLMLRARMGTFCRAQHFHCSPGQWMMRALSS